ncbi:hypothetical protein U1Q18_001249 [Sarracenia purpurea var. burkii]
MQPQLSVEATLPVEVLSEDIPVGLVQGASVSKAEKEIEVPEKAKDTLRFVKFAPGSCCLAAALAAVSAALVAIRLFADVSIAVSVQAAVSIPVSVLVRCFQSFLGVLWASCCHSVWEHIGHSVVRWSFFGFGVLILL